MAVPDRGARGRVSDTIAVSWHSQAQFSASPDLHNEFLSAVIGAMDSSDAGLGAHQGLREEVVLGQPTVEGVLGQRSSRTPSRNG